MADIIVTQSERTLVEVAFHLFQFIRFHLSVSLKVRLEHGADAVLFFFYHFLTLVNGEIECRHQLAVFPGLSYFELVIEFTVARHK